jgi:hypothetical protein
MAIREWAEEVLDEDSGVIFFDGFDDALIGLTSIYVSSPAGGAYQQQVSVYDWYKLIEVLIINGAENEEEAEEYISFNVENAYFGPATPLVVHRPCR